MTRGFPDSPTTRRTLALLAMLYVFLLLGSSGCGGGGGGGGGSIPRPGVSVNLANVNLALGASQPFTATVTNAASSGVTWRVQENGGGIVTSAGLYTAPSVAGTYHVIATSTAVPTASATITVNVHALVSITPANGTLAIGGTQTFTATVVGTTNTGVTWSIQEPGGGSVDANGLYTAPGVVGTYHVIAASKADATQTATATVTVHVLVSVAPASASLPVGGTQIFTTKVTGAMNTGVTWSIQEPGGGSVNANGLYTAPGVAGIYHVIASSKADPTQTATATVNVHVLVSVTPTTATVPIGGTQTFAATVLGATNTGVTWALQETGGGTITSAGLYTAPAVAGIYHVIATSKSDATQTTTATVTVQAASVSGTID